MTEPDPREIPLTVIQDGLRGGTEPEDRRVELLRAAIDRRKEFELAAFLTEIIPLPPNAPLLEYAVRAYGYAKDPDAFDRVAPYLDHEQPVIVVNAAKAASTLDPVRAVEACRSVLMGPDHRLAFAVAEVLAERCGSHAESLFLELAFSERSRQRALAVFYLKTLPPPEMAPLVLEMLRREQKSGLQDLLIQLLESRATGAERAGIQKLKDELTTKIGEVAALIGRMKAATPAGDPHSTSGSPGAAGDPPGASPLDRAPSFDEGGVSVSGRFRLDEPEASSFPTADEAQAERREDFERWKQKKWKEDRARRPRKTILHEIPERVDPYRKILAILFILVGGLTLAGGRTATPEEAPGSVPVPADSTLGNVGARVVFEATVTTVDLPGKTLMVRSPEGFEARVYFLHWDLSGFAPGDRLRVVGVMRQIRTATSFVVVGHSARPAPVEDP